ncbi:PPE domain-containing protein [Mycobacterium kansasii]
MAVRVDVGGLSAAGSRLAGSAGAYVSAVAVAPGADMTSVGAVGHLNALAAGLVARLNHASVLRELGGQAVINTAQVLVGHDEGNATAIAQGTTTAADPVAGLMSVPHVPAPQVPEIPQLPAALAPLPGEAHSHALYSGPGSNSVYAFAEHWSRHGDQLTTLADTLQATGQAIDEHWDRGQQQAGANTVAHARWVAQMGQQAHSLAAYARTVAHSFDQAKADTPSPQEFAHTRTQLNNAIQRYEATKGANAAEVQQLTQQYADQQAQATQSVTGYHSQVTSASFHLADTKDAPPITGGGTVPLDSHEWKQGDKRHRPYEAGTGGVGPPNYPDSPPWVDIWDRSGGDPDKVPHYFVRSDEIPHFKSGYPPGGPGPAKTFDAQGNLDPWIELGPNTGVYVPKSDFPGAVIIPPGSTALPPYGYDEYVPGSGIFLWHGDMVREPYNPKAPSVPPRTSPGGP